MPAVASNIVQNKRIVLLGFMKNASLRMGLFNGNAPYLDLN